MKAAYDVGINFFDCAEGYAGGESEKVRLSVPRFRILHCTKNV